MADPKITELTPDELNLGTFDPTQFPYQQQAAMLYWNGSAWEKTTGGSGYLKVQATILTSPITVNGTVTQGQRQTFTAAPVAFTATTSVTSILAADGTYGLDLCSIAIENNSATATEVVFYANNGTTEVLRAYCPAGDVRGIVFPAGRELTQGAINTAWKAKTVTSVSSVYITCQYIKNTSWSI